MKICVNIQFFAAAIEEEYKKDYNVYETEAYRYCKNKGMVIYEGTQSY